jgi:hypothetical protein
VRDLDPVILACKQGTCPWDYYNAPLYEDQDRHGRKIWVLRVRCLNRPSIKYERYKPNSRLRKQDRIGAPKYDRPDGWYDPEMRLYFGDARAERYKRGLIKITSRAT